MSYYLFMDGVDDKLQTPISANNLVEFEMDFIIEEHESWHRIVNFGNYGINFNSTTLNIQVADSFAAIYVDGVQVVFNTAFLTIGQRHVMRGVLKSGLNTGSTYSWFFTNSIAQFLKGRIYDIKLFRAGRILAAHYDFTLGNGLDQSGNGNHAIISGGTFIQDTPSSEDVVYTYTLEQRIYSDMSDNVSTRQIVYSDVTNHYDMVQLIYSDIGIEHPIQQLVYADADYNYPTKVVIYDDLSVTYPTKIIVYQDSSSRFKMIQRLFEEQIVQYPILITIIEMSDGVELIRRVYLKGSKPPVIMLKGKRQKTIILRGGI